MASMKPTLAAMTTDYASSYEGSSIKLVGSDMTAAAAKKVYVQSGHGPEDVDIEAEGRRQRQALVTNVSVQLQALHVLHHIEEMAVWGLV